MTASIAQLELGYDEHHPDENLDLLFARFMREQTDTFDALVEIVRELKALGQSRISMKFVVEIARYKFLVRQQSGERHAVNNSFTSRLARAIEKTHPEFAGLFEMREMKHSERD